MPAQIVERFALPLRLLPQACHNEQAFLAIADGPSSREYDLEALRKCPARKLCYGRVARDVPPDYYALADLGFAEVLDHLPPTRVLISRDGPYGGPDGPGHWARLPRDRGHEYVWAPLDCAHHPVLNCLALGTRHVFLLGHDGYHRNDGRLAQVSHAEDLHDTTTISRQRYAQRPAEQRRAEFWMADVNRLSWEITIKAMHKVQGVAAEIHNLSFGSRQRPVWEVHPEVLSQPFGRIDRRGEALLIHILEMDDEIDLPGCVPTVPRARWGALHVSNHAEFINGLRRIQPHLAIYVRTHARLEMLAHLLADDIQVGGLDATLDAGLHSLVSHFRLPPINDNWDPS